LNEEQRLTWRCFRSDGPFGRQPDLCLGRVLVSHGNNVGAVWLVWLTLEQGALCGVWVCAEKVGHGGRAGTVRLVLDLVDVIALDAVEKLLTLGVIDVLPADFYALCA